MKANLDSLLGALPPEVADDVELAIAILTIAGIAVWLIDYTQRRGLLFGNAARIPALAMIVAAVIAVIILIAGSVTRRLLPLIG